MSDALLTRIADALEGLLAHVKAAPKVAPAATKPATPPVGGNAGSTGGAAAGAGKPATPPAGKNPATAAGAAANKPKPGTAPAATKAPGGKYNSEQVRDIIRKVAANPALGKESARGVLNEDGGGVSTVSEVKPENFDAVYEACQVLLSGEGAGAGPAADEFDPTA